VASGFQAASRYYEADEDEEIRNNTECAVCGESGHDRKSCPHEQVSLPSLLCLILPRNVELASKLCISIAVTEKGLAYAP